MLSIVCSVASNEGLAHAVKVVQLVVENLIVTEGLLHIRDVVLARAQIISNITVLSNFLPEDAVKGRSRLKEAPIVALLPDLRAQLVSQRAECLVVRAQCEVVVSDSVLGCDRSRASAKHLLFINY